MFKTIIFDLDGTLTDPKEGIINCIHEALTKLERAIPLTDNLTWSIGPPLTLVFSKLLQTQNSAIIDRAIAYYRDRYGKKGYLENIIYPGVVRLLEQLKAQGYKLFVATSKLEVNAIKILKHFAIVEFFSNVYGASGDGVLSTKEEILAHLLKKEQIQGCECLMIGDREYDVIGAKQHQMDCLGVLYGYGTAQELQTAGAVALCDSPEHVASWLLQFPNA